MRNRLLTLTLAISAGVLTRAEASIVTLSGQRTGPVAISIIDGNIVSGGLIRIGTLTGEPADETVDSFNAVFAEFGTSVTAERGTISTSVSNSAASPFDNQQIYLWVFDTPDVDSSSPHSMFTVQDPDAPSAGDPWRFPTHTGTGTDSVTVSLAALFDGGGRNVINTAFDAADGGKIILTVPEPTSSLLVVFASGLFFLRRRR